jgi:hypothetical protein
MGMGDVPWSPRALTRLRCGLSSLILDGDARFATEPGTAGIKTAEPRPHVHADPSSPPTAVGSRGAATARPELADASSVII